MAKKAIRSDDSRTAILAAAEKLFAARGLQEVTISEVADAAGVARATVFNQFGSKHALIDAITAEVLSGYVQLLLEALADRETATPALVRGLFGAMGNGIQQNARFYRAIFREIAKISLGLDEGGEAHAQRGAAMNLLRQLHLRGQARGELTRAQPAEDLASAFDGLVFGTIIHWLYEDQRESLAERMRAAADLLLGGVAGEPQRAPARSKRRRLR
jgi:AcrR family transcriptional regulator